MRLKSSKVRLFVTAIFGVLLLITDQAVKLWAANSLKPKNSIRFIRFGDFRIIDLTYLENRGAMFGFMEGKSWFLIGVTSTVMITLTVMAVRVYRKSEYLAFNLFLFVFGGIGNLIDRIRLGYVIDMFEIKLFQFAVFNVADICVSFAMVMFVIYIFFIEPKANRKIKDDKEKTPENAG